MFPSSSYLLAVVLLLVPTAVISYELLPRSTGFGAEVDAFNITLFLESHGVELDGDIAGVSDEARSTVDALKRALHDHRFLHFPLQDGLTWQDQLMFVQLFGKPFDESLHPNRIPWEGEKDPQVAIFSNDKKYGLVGVGIEGFHSDGNVVEIPHQANFLYCEQTVKGAATLLAPLEEVRSALPNSLLHNVDFSSSHVENLEKPLAHHHPASGRPTMFFGLGTLSGLYKKDDKSLTQEETDVITSQIEAAIEKVGPYRHEWTAGSLLVMDNLALVHKASSETQVTTDPSEIRIMRRVTLAAKRPLRRRDESFEKYPHRCDDSTCLVSLARHVEVEPDHSFPGVEEGNELCRGYLHQTASLASLSSKGLAKMATEIVEELRLPHFLNARKFGTGFSTIRWGSATTEDEWNDAYPWDDVSGQPNDCDGPGSEPCVFIGPKGRWFDFACNPKRAVGTTPGPEITWGEVREMFDIYSLCQVSVDFFGTGGGGKEEL
ncbi:hypothetical protein TL16_g01209 [Triparma laevis f. inornata]|uniref:C-type lectin domain-containing protein n=1 Tax=Triparma laevis f. inornata TaxID=1714386 RepID=A0A9W6ZJ96_9STRA|nr:hypothetical protein TL16_g01209 [Triparma laevis f. inornata]